MAGLYIPWPEKPECCIYCPCYDKHGNCNAARRELTTTQVFVQRPEWCRAQFVPDHGRLVDADDVNNHIHGWVDLRTCPTIIPADKEA